MLTVLGLAEMPDDAGSAGTANFFAGKANGATARTGFTRRGATKVGAGTTAASPGLILGDIRIHAGLTLRAFAIAKATISPVTILAWLRAITIACAGLACGRAQA